MHRWLLALLLLSLGVALHSPAQPSRDDRDLFAQTKAQAERGDAEAQLTLGSMYANGAGGSVEPSKAAKWHRKAAEQGLARAQYQLGLDYADGFGVKPDPVEAVNWIYKAAAQGLLEAQLALGLCYARGEGVRLNGVEAVKWFRKAAGQGSAAAAYQLGLAYFEGTGVPRDLDQAVQWTRQAAEQGYPPAQYRYGTCFEKGEGVPRDLVEAYKWYTLAAAQDDQRAAEIRVNIAKIESAMTKEQVAAAQRLARDFKPAVPGETRAAPVSAAAASAQTNAPGAATAAAAPATGFVNVKADDESSEVFADGAFVGNPPARLKLAEGKHLIEVRKSGFKEYRREIAVTPGSDLTLRVALEKQP